MPSKIKSKRKIAVCLIALVMVFSSLFTGSAFAYYQNPSASVLFHWSMQISGGNPRITVYGRNPSTGEPANNAIYNMNGLNGHSLYIDNVYRPVYCLNPNQEADSNYVDGTSYKAVRWGKLTADQQDLIMRALYCGYPNTTDGSIEDQTGNYALTSAQAQHLALQAMIFNIRCNFIVKNGTGVKATRDYNDAESFDERLAPEYDNFHNAYANLFARMNSFMPSVDIPSFSTLSSETAAADKTILLEPDASGNYSATVTDSNGVLGYYNFASLNGSGISYSVSGNTLTITATPAAAANLSSATRKGNVSSSAPDVNLTVDDLTFYVKGGSGTDGYQTMVEYVSSSMSKTYKSVYLMLRAEANGFIKVVKSSALPEVTDGNSSYSLEGAVFSIYATRADAEAKRSPVGTIMTDARGEGTSDSLAPATYYVRETTPPHCYELSDEIQTASVTGGNTVTLNETDMPVTKDFMLKKRSSYTGFMEGNSSYSLAGAQYGVYDSEADANADVHRIETLTTDASGNANSSKKYALGRTLYIKELKASPGYLLDTQAYSVTIANSNKNSVSVKEVPTGDAGHLRIRKVDGEGTELKTITESAAVFKVEFFTNGDWSGTAVKTWFFKTAEGICWLNDSAYLDTSQTNAEFYTDADGTVCFPIGTVKITEITAPTGYVKSDAELLAKITQDSSGAPAVWHWTTDAGGVISYEAEGASFKNTPIRGNLKIVKRDAYEDIPLSGAGFRLFDGGGHLIDEGYTDANGELTFENLLYGSYSYQEFAAPKGYELDDTVYPFSITEHSVTITQERSDLRRPGTLEVKKQDQNGKPLAGATFLLECSTDNGASWTAVFSRSGDNVQAGGCTSPGLSDGQLTTGDNGSVTFSGLRADSSILYRLTETQAPVGHSLLGSPLYVGTLPVEISGTAEDSETVDGVTCCYTLYVTATDDPLFRLPETGGAGFAWLPYVMGFLTMPYIITKRKDERET